MRKWFDSQRFWKTTATTAFMLLEKKPVVSELATLRLHLVTCKNMSVYFRVRSPLGKSGFHRNQEKSLNFEYAVHL